jgi:hypothetical protein
MIDFSVETSEWLTKEDLEASAEAEIKEYIGTIFRASVRLSPVYTGSFRASWRVSLNAPREDVTVRKDPANPLRGAAFRWPPGFKLGDDVYISNNLPYAHLIEYEGWSKQAPFGVLRVAVALAG